MRRVLTDRKGVRDMHMVHRLALASLCALACVACGSSADRRGEVNASGSIGDFFTIDTVLFLGNEEPSTEVSLFTHASVSDGRYFLYYPSLLQGDSAVGVIRVNALDQSIDTLHVSIADRRKPYGAYVADIDVSGDTIAILLFDGLFVFVAGDGSPGRPDASIAPAYVAELDQSYNQVVLRGQQVLLMKCSLGTLSHPREMTQVLTVDLTSHVLPKPQYFPNPQGVEFVSFVPRSLIAADGSRIFVSDLSRYRIIVYDTSGRPTDSIVRSPEQWIDVYGLGYPGIDQSDLVNTNREQGERVSQRMDHLRSFAYTMSSIRLIQTMNDSTLLVTFATGRKLARGMLEGHVEVKHDIWHRTKSGWRPLQLDIDDFNPERSQRLADERMLPLTYTYKSTMDERVPMYQIQPMKPPTDWQMSYGDFVDAMGEGMDGTAIPYSVVFYRMR